MKLYYQTHSPFARKVLVFAYEAGIADYLEVLHFETSPTNKNKVVFKANPLGKVPILELSDGKTIFDSSVICEHINYKFKGTNLIPANPEEYILAKRLEALADGLSEAGILARWEMERRPKEYRYPPFLEGQMTKITEGYSFIEKNILLDSTITIGEIALATSLSWLEFRELPSFRENYPKLATWFEEFSKRDSMKNTELSGNTHD